jgi:hypothetical protein
VSVSERARWTDNTHPHTKQHNTTHSMQTSTLTPTPSHTDTHRTQRNLLQHILAPVKFVEPRAHTRKRAHVCDLPPICQTQTQIDWIALVVGHTHRFVPSHKTQHCDHSCLLVQSQRGLRSHWNRRQAGAWCCPQPAPHPSTSLYLSLLTRRPMSAVGQLSKHVCVSRAELRW